GRYARTRRGARPGGGEGRRSPGRIGGSAVRSGRTTGRGTSVTSGAGDSRAGVAGGGATGAGDAAAGRAAQGGASAARAQARRSAGPGERGYPPAGRVRVRRFRRTVCVPAGRGGGAERDREGGAHGGGR